MKLLVALLFIPSALLRRNAQGFVYAESTPGGVIWGTASDGYLLTQEDSEQKRIMTKDERADSRLGKYQTGNNRTTTTHGAFSKRREQDEGLGQANHTKVKTQLLKEPIGGKINRMCEAEIAFPFIPPSYISVTTEDSKAGAFRMLTYNKDNALPLTWEVYFPVEPLTATKRNATEAKWYNRALAENNDGPSDDDHDFFPGGIHSEGDEALPPIGKDDLSEEHQLRNSIDHILNWVYRIDKDGRKVLITQEELNNSMKEDLMKYCQLMKQVDTSGTLEVHQMGNEIEVFNNLIELLRKHQDETVSTLRRKLRNPAVCMKNVGEWILKRRGLVLPDSSSSNASEHDANLVADSRWIKCVKSNSIGASTDKYNREEDGMVDWEKLKMRSKHICGFNGGLHSGGERSNGDDPEGSNGKDLCSPKDKEEVE
uniref:Pco-TSERA1 protein n=1 Tax=Plasmodium coatneyi TaxID=208452 RepID=F1SZ02_9APIC|nr:Pco-TSERA1 [Plasmodium coatneyi]